MIFSWFRKIGASQTRSALRVPYRLAATTTQPDEPSARRPRDEVRIRPVLTKNQKEPESSKRLSKWSDEIDRRCEA